MTVRIRVRGIYATAVTELLREAVSVVDPSDPIRRRFGTSFEEAPADVVVRDADDRQGVRVVGPAAAVAPVADHLRVARDAFVWSDATPLGAVFDGRITDTLGSGAVVDLGESEGFLPYGNVADYVESGDPIRVQVTGERSPWSDDRAVLDTTLRVERDRLALVRGGSATDSDGVDRIDLLSVDTPPGWHVRWRDGGDDASLDVLEAALAAAVDRAEAIDGALADTSERGGMSGAAPGRLDDGREAVWVWFGRESRFALDDRRRAVAPTLPGHHRIKAGDEHASAAVDFAEAICADALAADAADAGVAWTGDEPSGFPFDAVASQFGPAAGDRLAIAHGKPDGRLLVLGEGEVTDVDPAGQVTLRREMTPGGRYDGLGVERRAGDVATTRVREGRWWYPTVYRSADGDVRGTYVNICTPVEVFPRQIRYVDLHVDVVRHGDGSVERVDDDELDAAVDAGHVTDQLAARARDVAGRVADAL